MYCIDNLFTFDVLFVLFETFFYHTIYLAPSLYFDIATRISLFLYFYFFIFFIVAVIATTTQQYLGIKGLLRLFLCVLGGLLIAILFSFILITRSGASFFLEYKIYSIYIPTVVSSLTFTLDYLSASFMFLVTAIGIAAVAYARVYLYGDPHTPDFLVKLV
jgi:NADH:ubiquinone oxidoreductase subunit 5 (subunit L)/multisubunit Na+/H+ antiporter MnhA subunit